VKQFVRTLIPEPITEPIIRFETEPGQQMQADWGDGWLWSGPSVGVQTAPSRVPANAQRMGLSDAGGTVKLR
jgi:hypothetical protein